MMELTSHYNECILLMFTNIQMPAGVLQFFSQVFQITDVLFYCVDEEKLCPATIRGNLSRMRKFVLRSSFTYV